MSLNQYRKGWLQKEFSIKDLHRSKRHIEQVPVVEKCLQWCLATSSDHFIIDYDISDVKALGDFAETF